MDMCLSIIRNGVKEPYSEQQFRRDNPNASFPKGLVVVDLDAYGVVLEPKPKRAVAVVQKLTSDCVPMHCFLYGLREFGLRVQMEHYVLCQQGHARDYWLTAPHVHRSSTYVGQLAEYFGLSALDLDIIFIIVAGIEE